MIPDEDHQPLGRGCLLALIIVVAAWVAIITYVVYRVTR